MITLQIIFSISQLIFFPLQFFIWTSIFMSWPTAFQIPSVKYAVFNFTFYTGFFLIATFKEVTTNIDLCLNRTIDLLDDDPTQATDWLFIFEMLSRVDNLGQLLTMTIIIGLFTLFSFMLIQHLFF